MNQKLQLKNYNVFLVLLIITINIIGIMAIGSAKESVQSRQVAGMILGVFLMFFISFFNYNLILKFHWLIYGLNIALLLLVEIFGDSANNAQRWLMIPFIDIKFQPSELAKILLILFYAKFIMDNKENLNTLKSILIMLALLAPVLILVVKQPDLSTTILLGVVFCMLIYIGGLSRKIIMGVLAVTIPAAAIFLFLVLQPDQHLIKDYQQRRILAWLDPEEYALTDAWQTENSITAIGSGKLTGKGLDNNEVSSVINGNYISEAQTDFIFAVIGEEMGFIGCASVIMLLMLISGVCFYMGIKAGDTAGELICFGVGTIVGVQSFLNISVTTGLTPNTGVPLPFVSYGLTSLVSLYIGMGFVLSVGLHRKDPPRKTTELGQISSEI
ncbi:MAG: rod shape-determining protein RodA [Lachnospiraceae bacterium]|nr:rod shape-determining protein RodA [Lachnospiraceae bacterium]